MHKFKTITLYVRYTNPIYLDGGIKKLYSVETTFQATQRTSTACKYIETKQRYPTFVKKGPFTKANRQLNLNLKIIPIFFKIIIGEKGYQIFIKHLITKNSNGLISKL